MAVTEADRDESAQVGREEMVGREGTIVLPDGRKLGYMEYGDPGGLPMLGFHGTPGSRFMLMLAHDAAADLGIRLLAPERPGFGLSTFQKGRTLAGWAQDMDAFTKALGIERFAVAGVSGGGPYAAACAAALPDRVMAVGLVSPIGPVVECKGVGWGHYCAFRVFPRIPGVVQAIFALGRALFLYWPRGIFGLIISRAAVSDWKVLSQGTVRRNLIRGVAEGFRPGIRGGVEEMRIFSRAWDVDLTRVRAPCILWQGLADRNVPVASALWLGELIPGCRVHRIEGAGHYWVFDNIREVLSSIASAATGAGGP